MTDLPPRLELVMGGLSDAESEAARPTPTPEIPVQEKLEVILGIQRMLESSEAELSDRLQQFRSLTTDSSKSFDARAREFLKLTNRGYYAEHIPTGPESSTRLRAILENFSDIYSAALSGDPDISFQKPEETESTIKNHLVYTAIPEAEMAALESLLAEPQDPNGAEKPVTNEDIRREQQELIVAWKALAAQTSRQCRTHTFTLKLAGDFSNSQLIGFGQSPEIREELRKYRVMVKEALDRKGEKQEQINRLVSEPSGPIAELLAGAEVSASDLEQAKAMLAMLLKQSDALEQEHLETGYMLRKVFENPYSGDQPMRLGDLPEVRQR